MSGKSMIFVGGLLLFIGFIWLINNLGLTSINLDNMIGTYWPVIFILWGLDVLGQELLGRKNQQVKRVPRTNSVVTGFILLIIGTLILGRNLKLFHFNLAILWDVFWPLVVILIGWSLFRGTRRMSGLGSSHWAVMSGLEFKKKGWKLDDSNIFTLMGGVELDLTVAEIPAREVLLNLVAIMGGITVKVPRDINVVGESTAVLGGLTILQEEAGGIIAGRKTEYIGAPASQKKLVIKALAVMGSIEVKH